MKLDPDQLTIVGAIDPASQKQNTEIRGQLSSQALAVVGADHLDRVYLLHLWFGRVSTPEFIDEIVKGYERFPAMTRYGCEANGLQELFGNTIEMIVKSRGINLPLEEQKQPTRMEKEARIRFRLQPRLAFGQFFIQKHYDEVRQAIITFPQVEKRLMDVIDVIASAIDLLPATPMQIERDMRIEGLASYLKKAGVAPAIAARRVEDFAFQLARGTR